jgi:CelD/BcsL family acetyltransferase involved in cellulose biosynthesis
MKLEKISLSDETAIAKWDDFVRSHPLATPNHLSSWLKTISATYSFEPFLYAATADDGALAGIFPLFRIQSPFTGTRMVSLPFSDYGGPLCSHPDLDAEMVALVRGERRSGTQRIEIRGPLDHPGDLLRFSYYKRHVLDLRPGIETIQKNIDKKTILYSVRKAEKSGVTIRRDDTKAGLDEFCRLNNLTRKKHGVPSQPRAFFDNLFSCMISTGNGFILVASHESDVIAASLFLTVAKRIHYKYNASDPANLKKYSPNHFLTWHVISWGVEQGFESLDFGRTSPDNEGLIRYKNMWGMKDMELPYYYFPRVNGAASTKENGLGYRWMTSVWRRLPLPVAESASRVLYKHLG